MRARSLLPALLIALAVLIVAGLAALVYRFDPSKGYAFYPRCRFFELTGLRCPGCGATRATYQLLHGNVGSAFYYNALYVAALPLLLLWGARWLWLTWHEIPPTPAGIRHGGWIAGTAVTFLIVFWIVRNLPGWPLF